MSQAALWDDVPVCTVCGRALVDGACSFGHFEPPNPRHMARRDDPTTSHQAAAHVAAQDLSPIKRQILALMRVAPRSARETADILGKQRGTISKRVQDLAESGHIESVGVETLGGPTPATTFTTRETS